MSLFVHIFVDVNGCTVVIVDKPRGNTLDDRDVEDVEDVEEDEGEEEIDCASCARKNEWLNN